MLTDEQYAALSQLSLDTGVPVSLLVRDAIERTYFEQAQRTRRRAALQRLLALDAPVADWDQMEAEIERGAATCAD